MKKTHTKKPDNNVDISRLIQETHGHVRKNSEPGMNMDGSQESTLHNWCGNGHQHHSGQPENSKRQIFSVKPELLPVETKLVGDSIGNGLCVGGRARSAAEDAVVDRSELIRYPVRNVCPVGVCKKQKQNKNVTIYHNTPFHNVIHQFMTPKIDSRKYKSEIQD